jgi:trk system potassium uptake protein TrkH
MMFIGIISLAMIFPLVTAIAYKEKLMIQTFLYTIPAPLLISLAIFIFRRNKKIIYNAAEGIMLVFLAWVFSSFLGAFPYYLSGYIPRFSDAFFESVSGFTTTGATVIPDVEILPYSLHLWRAMTHWLGGMGIIVLTVALLPMLGVGGFQLLKNESPGPETEKFTPKVTMNAKTLWLLYLGFTTLQVVLLILGGMSWIDAVVHAFSAMATGGFSTRNESIAYYNSSYIEWVCIIFMLLAGFNFTLIYRLLQGKFREIIRNSEAKAYGLIIVVSVLVVAFSLNGDAGLGYSLGKSIRNAFFHVSSILTTTGFMTSDHNLWPPLARAVLFFLLFIGGCSGSTAGGIKVIRHLILFKQAKNEMKKLLYPKGVFSIQLDQKTGKKDIVYGVSGFIYLYFVLIFAGALLAGSAGSGLFDSLNASLIIMGNIGLGLGKTISGLIFYDLPAYAKYGLSFLMIAGRLELVTAFVFFVPEFWR